MKSAWENWNDWVLLKSLDWKSVPASPGTYMIAVERALSRAEGVDEEGILYIGKATTLRSRLQAFFRCAGNPGTAGHIAGWRFAMNKLSERFPLETLYVCWMPAISEEQAAIEESRLLHDYIKQHIDTPPLNYSLSRRHLSA